MAETAPSAESAQGSTAVETQPQVERLRIEVVYARPQRAFRVALELPAGTTALAAFEASGLRARVPELAQATPDLGVFAHPVGPGQVLRDGDRLEVYRPLLIDPKDARRQRAAQGGSGRS